MSMKQFAAKLPIIFIGFVVLAVSACGHSNSSSDTINPQVTSPIGTRSFLKPLTVNGDIIKTENRFLSFAKSLNRISIINPDQAIETWSKSISDFNFAIALPDFLGAALLSSNSVAIMSGDAAKQFQLSIDYAHASNAKNNVAYSLASVDGTSFEVIRSLTNGQWQHETFTVPWNPIDPTIVSPPTGQPVLLVTQYNAEGTMLAVFSPADGRYAIYTAVSNTSPLLTTSIWCASDGVGTPQNARFRSLIWDENRKVFFAGDKDGRIYALDPNLPCPATIDNVVNLLMPINSQINQIAIYDNGDLGVLQTLTTTSSQISIVSFDSVNFTNTGKTISPACEQPFSSISTNDAINRHIIVMCRQKSSPQNGSTNPEEQVFTDPTPYIYAVHEYSSGNHVNTVSIDPTKTSGVTINIATNTLYRMDEGAFGILETINILTGETASTTGLFISELFD